MGVAFVAPASAEPSLDHRQVGGEVPVTPTLKTVSVPTATVRDRGCAVIVGGVVNVTIAGDDMALPDALVMSTASTPASLAFDTDRMGAWLFSWVRRTPAWVQSWPAGPLPLHGTNNTNEPPSATVVSAGGVMMTGAPVRARRSTRCMGWGMDALPACDCRQRTASRADLPTRASDDPRL